MEEQWTYQQAGVDVEAGYEAVRKMSEHVAKTKIPGVLGGLGSFGGMFELPQGYEQPVLVSGTDGVGTKLSIAFQTGKHDTIGIDCVAMCVNDIVCQGAKPLFFLDYIGTGVLDPSQVANIVKGISQGCINSGCALIGGETAEMPDFYKPQEYDLAGFAVGIVEKSKIITGKDIKEGDSLIGIASSGLHSNGYSLVRKLVETQQIALNTYLEPLGKTLGEELLTPTKLYVNLALALIEKFDIKGMAHITGGGWIENIPRMFAGKTLKAVVNKDNATILPIFSLLKEWGNMTEEACYNTFNMGIGLVLAVPSEDVDEIIAFVQEQGEQAYLLGTVNSCGKEEERVSFV